MIYCAGSLYAEVIVAWPRRVSCSCEDVRNCEIASRCPDDFEAVIFGDDDLIFEESVEQLSVFSPEVENWLVIAVEID